MYLVRFAGFSLKKLKKNSADMIYQAVKTHLVMVILCAVFPGASNPNGQFLLKDSILKEHMFLKKLSLLLSRFFNIILPK